MSLVLTTRRQKWQGFWKVIYIIASGAFPLVPLTAAAVFLIVA